MIASEEINSIRLDKDLRSVFHRYLYSSNLISDTETELQGCFAHELLHNFEITKGPFISCNPCYKPSYCLEDLMKGKEGIAVSQDFKNFATDQLDIRLRLYSHQVQAFKLLSSGNNLVVATGTGSGKTESFLIPILNDIMNDPSSGLRAIIIYPMNALANDQLERMRGLLSSSPQITFGRYTGETPWKPKSADPTYMLPNERVYRSEMRENPPHILLTNFAMLEYLLFRPRDSFLFKDHRVKFVVLDEAHTYSGAQGIDIGMLMRRLQTYLYPRAKNNIQFILTSATMGSEENSKREIAKFASDLTGASFNESSVLVGELTSWFSSSLIDKPSLDDIKKFIKNDDDLDKWTKAVNKGDRAWIVASLEHLGLRPPNTDLNGYLGQLLYETFSRCKLLSKIHEACLSNAVTLADLCEHIGLASNDENKRAVNWLFTMGSYARLSKESSPLFPTRLHFFCRGISGATVCLSPRCTNPKKMEDTFWASFFLEDRDICDHCGAHVFPISTCVHCGFPVVRVQLENATWKKSNSLALSAELKLLTWRPDLLDDDQEDDNQLDTVALCLACKKYLKNPENTTCCQNPNIIKLYAIKGVTDEGHLATCPCCGSSRGSHETVLREFRTSDEAPTAVLAENLIRHLPEHSGRDNSANLPAYGKNLLVFSDSRQQAAFFAPYLEYTTLESAYLRPLQEAIERTESDEGAPVSIAEVARNFVTFALKYPFVVFRCGKEDSERFEIRPSSEVKSAAKTDLKREIELRLYQDFCSIQLKKNTLRGLAIADTRIDFTPSEIDMCAKEIPELFAGGEEQGNALLQALANIFLFRKAVNFDDWILTTDLFHAGSRIFTFHKSLSGVAEGRQRIRWNPYDAPSQSLKNAINKNRQLSILSKTLNLDTRKDQTLLNELLIRIWEFYTGTVLKSHNEFPGEFRLNKDFILVTQNLNWHKCDRCGLLSSFGALGVCLNKSCSGKLEYLSPDDLLRKFELNHYRQRFNLEPLPLRVKEHTAQLENRLGGEYQKNFLEGKINVLSCSTTFEMGVDVGNLKAVLLRNVPPTTSSYIQRAGRAGRRRDGVSLAITYCRNLPHDQYHFFRPEKMILGSIPTPYINISNIPICQRHCNAALLGNFLRYCANPNSDFNDELLDNPTLSDFFVSEYDGKTLAHRFTEWTQSHDTVVENSRILKSIIPPESGLTPESVLKVCTESLLISKDSLYKSQIIFSLQQFDREVEQLNVEIEETNDVGKRSKLRHSLTSAERLREQFKNQKLINFLSSACWLPSYAFPQDIVKLLVRHPGFLSDMRLERDREIGITEYAPGSEIIANGRVFTSAGLWLKSKEPEIKMYVSCPNCRTIETASGFKSSLDQCGVCGHLFKGRDSARFYIKPDGFSTMVDDEPSYPRMSRRRPPKVSEIFLLEGTQEFQHHQIDGIQYGFKKNGKLFRANRNYGLTGFRICPKCGKSDSIKQKKMKNIAHQTAWGTKCGGTFKIVDLVHEIVTDILQLRFQHCKPPTPMIEEKEFWESFLSAFLNGASESLGISRSDIGGTYHGWTTDSHIGELVIYDRVPGGAGHIPRIMDNLGQVLESAYDRVNNCQCNDIQSSCYACLRSFSNQFAWDFLKRAPVIDWLGKILHSS